MAQSLESLEEKKTEESEKTAVTIPEFFLSPNRWDADDFRLIVEGECLHVSKGHLAYLSDVLGATFFSKGCKEAENGEVEIEEQTLSSVLLFLCWAYDIPYPDSEGKEQFAIGGDRANGIAFEDIPELMHIADYWQVDRLQLHCRRAYCEYVRKGKHRADKATVLEAWEMLEWVMKGAGLEQSHLVDVFQHLEHISPKKVQSLDISPEFRFWLWKNSVPLLEFTGFGSCIGGYTEMQERAIQFSVLAGMGPCHDDVIRFMVPGDHQPIQAATLFYSYLAEMQDLAALDSGQGITPRYQEPWAGMSETERTQSTTLSEALFYAARFRPHQIQMDGHPYHIGHLQQTYRFLRPTLTHHFTGHALIQDIMLRVLRDGDLVNWEPNTRTPPLFENAFGHEEYGHDGINILALITALPNPTPF